MEKIKIGYKTYDIIYDNKGLQNDGLYGQIDYDGNKIRLRSDYDKTEQLNTFIHEVLHGILYQSGYKNLREDENLINCIANGLTQVVVDNGIKDILNAKPKIDKHESWIGKKVRCWDNNKPDRPNVMEYVGFNAEDYMPYKCNNKGIIFLWKNIELVDDKK